MYQLSYYVNNIRFFKLGKIKSFINLFSFHCLIQLLGLHLVIHANVTIIQIIFVTMVKIINI